MIELFTYPDSVRLANTPTRIFQAADRLTDWVGDRELLVKRDDETGCGASGNKIRKLEFFAAEALAAGAQALITGGNRLSNHARTTANVARELGLDVHLMLSGNGTAETEGNLFLDRILGAHVHYVPMDVRWTMGELMDKLAHDLRAEGVRPYIVPAGGTCPLGVLAYVRCAQEIREQLATTGATVDAVTVAVGSGSTAAGLILGARMFDLGCPIYGIHISRSPERYPPLLRDLIERTRERYGIETEVPEEDIRIIPGYVGNGYGETTPEELRFIHDMAVRTGLLLDPTYTGKAFRGTLTEMKSGMLKDYRRVLFVHTGGIYGLFNHREGILREAGAL